MTLARRIVKRNFLVPIDHAPALTELRNLIACSVTYEVTFNSYRAPRTAKRLVQSADSGPLRQREWHLGWPAQCRYCAQHRRVLPHRY